jgi:enoyl-CoA hydratase/carnithine racemase
MFSPAGIPGEQSLLELASAPDDELLGAIETFQDGFTWWRSCDAITVAAVHGHAVGAGFQLALACDLIVTDPSALFSMRETSLGLVPDLAGTAPLVEAVGYSRALEICASGREIDADEALRIGLTVHVTGPGYLAAGVNTLLEPILAAPAQAVTATKHLLRGAQHRHPRDQRAAERAAQLDRIRSFV